MAKLIEVDGGRAVELGLLTTIGRDPSNLLCLGDPLVALRHAEVRRDPEGRYRLIDLGSRSGTFHGKRRVSECALEDGDELLIGSARLRFVADPPRQDEAPRAPEAHPQLFPPAAQIGDPAELRRSYDRLRACALLARALADAEGPQQVLEAALDHAVRELGGERGLAVVLNPATMQPTLQVVHSRQGEQGELSLSTSLLSEVIRRREGLLTTEAGDGDARIRAASLDAQSLRSALCVPVLHHGRLLGAFLIASRGAGTFGSAQLGLLELIALQAAPALEAALLAERTQAIASDERMRLGRLVGELPEGLVLLDATRHVAMANRRGEEFLGLLTFGGGVGDKIERLGGLALADLLEQKRRDVAVNGPPRRVLELRATESRHPDGSEVVLALRDVTEEREHEARLAQQDRLALIGQLAGSVAHDFNNLLTVISNFATFAREGASELRVREDAREIERAAKRAHELVRQLLAFGRRELVRPEVVLLEQVLDGMRPMLTRLLGAQVKLEVRRCPEPFRVKMDPGRMEQVILNLAVNGRDAMAGRGTLVIETAAISLSGEEAGKVGLAPGSYAAFSVRDAGVGMTPEVMSRLFEPFFTTKEKGKGTGLGLATVSGIVQQAGGAVTVQSEPGKGSEFRVLLPATDEPMHVSGAGLIALTGGSETVLVAEDEEALREMIRRILSSAGYRVVDAPDGESALELARKSSRIHLLLTDLVMPGMGGRELARRLGQERPDVRVLYVSGYFGEDGGAPAEGRFLPKPFSREQLLAQVRVALSDGQAGAGPR